MTNAPSASRQAALLAQGWVRQFTAEEPRLSEAVAAYRDLGFEVRLEAVDVDACRQSGQCSACFATPRAAQRCKIIFTRKPGAAPAP